MICDFCNKNMDKNEVRVSLSNLSGKVEPILGGHMACAIIFMKQIMVSGLEE